MRPSRMLAITTLAAALVLAGCATTSNVQHQQDVRSVYMLIPDDTPPDSGEREAATEPVDAETVGTVFPDAGFGRLGYGRLGQLGLHRFRYDPAFDTLVPIRSQGFGEGADFGESDSGAGGFRASSAPD